MQNPTGIDELSVEFRADTTAKVENGVGVYVIGVESPDGSLVPWYVGQTYSSFGSRIIQHFRKPRLQALADKGPLKIVLIARARDGKLLPSQTGKKENATES